MRIIPLPGLTPYDEALALQEAAVAQLLAGGHEQAFFLQHPPCFTTGTGAEASELLNTGTIPVIPTGRGGKTTYHGPGQRVVYIVKDLRPTKDLRAYIKTLQTWLITSLADLNVQAFTTDDIGVWVGARGGNAPSDGASRHAAPLGARHPLGHKSAHSASFLPENPAKIAAIGVRVRKWVAFHGIALNVNPDLTAYQRIIPCGLQKPVTSLHALGVTVPLQTVDEALHHNLIKTFTAK